jgi:ADP-ribose pyrophosphatase
VNLHESDVKEAIVEMEKAGVSIVQSANILNRPVEPMEPGVQWEGKFLRVLKSGRWEYVDRRNCSGGVAIVAVTEEGKLILTEQHRIPLGARVIELPAGMTADSPETAGEAAEAAARRELVEETGYEAEEMECLTSGPPSAGLASEVITFFQARGLRRVGTGGGHGHEEIVVHEIAVREVDRWLKDRAAAGLLIDPKVYAGLYFLNHGL